MNRCRFANPPAANPTTDGARSSSPRPSTSRSLVAACLLALFAALLVGCGGGEEPTPVEGLESTNVRPVVSPDPLEGLQPSDFSTPEESQVLQVWCVYEFDTDACIELDQKFGLNQSNNFGLPADLKTRSAEVLDAECANGTQDRVSCAELATR